ncbi:Asparagine--tRNA ligase [termite gut metagenome]|uniref:asparagine--tRNA ligase n=1 Tax=termite gut metagenome TaxID=433724 RepID=A0A5J4RUK3_9ZZZZ
MEKITRTRIVDLLTREDYGTPVNVKGWVRTRRGSKQIHFIALNDGSTINNVQIVVDLTNFDEEILKLINTGACLSINGLLTESTGSRQKVEVQAREIEVLGTCDSTYPLQKKGHSLEFLREIAHLRPRTNTFGAVFRIRHNMAIAIHQFFHGRGFFYFHSPIITASDCEGAGQMFQVTTLNLYDLKKDESGSIDYDNDFFGKQASLTVSGQLEGELAAMSLGAVYTFGPTFRAENSNTPRHLAEFWMIEPEMAFYEIEENMQLAEDFIKYCLQWALDHCKDDIQFLNDLFDKELIDRLNAVLSNNFIRLSYTEGIRILEDALSTGHKFEFPIYWGADLASEHERYLVEEHFKCPVILTDYPKEIKSFYMKQNDDGKTVRAMDVLFPKIGEIIGGSQREENYDKLSCRAKEMGVPEKDIWWYMDTRRFGTAPHSGFGLGFERLMLFITGMTNIRDVIPFPRTPRNADF